MDQTDRYAIELRGIDKRFGEVYANKLIDLKVPQRQYPRHCRRKWRR